MPKAASEDRAAMGTLAEPLACSQCCEDAYRDIQTQQDQCFRPYKMAIDPFPRIRLCLLVAYFALGCYCGYRMELSPCDTVYFVMVTVTTVGYGDISFKTNGDRLFGVLFILTGVVIVGVTLSTVIAKATMKAEEWAHDVTVRMRKPCGDCHSSSSVSAATNARGEMSSPTSSSNPIHRLARKYEAHRVKLRRDFFNCLLNLGVMFGVWTLVMMWFENWDWISALYFCVVTATSVGYGDVVPMKSVSKLVTVVFIFAAFFHMAHAFAMLYQLPISFIREGRLSQCMLRHGAGLKAEQLQTILKSKMRMLARCGRHPVEDPLSVSRAEFALMHLVFQQKITMDDLDHSFDVFDVLDSNNTDTLDWGDLSETKRI